MKIKNFDTFGVMLDMSRNAVMNVEALKKYFAVLKKMGYNCVMLYTEDTYEVEGEPFFGYMRGRYSMDELRELDEYAANMGIELIPCIQSLAHYTAFVRWNRVPVDIDDTLMVGEERTYEFIENTIKTVRKCFRTSRIHIGMDEAWKLGRGKYHNKNGCEEATSIIKKHLARVNEIVKKYDFEPMIWSDMFFRSISDNQYYLPKMEMPRETVEALPENVIPVYWDYYHLTREEYDAMLCNHEQLSDKTWFAGGIWTWRGFLPCNQYSLDTMRPALDECVAHGVRNVIFTMWGDDGGECSHYATLPTLHYAAALASGKSDPDEIRKDFYATFGEDVERLLALDLPDTVSDAPLTYEQYAKAALYNDPFYGLFDPCMKEGMNAYSGELCERFAAYAADANGEFADLYDMAAKQCAVLAK